MSTPDALTALKDIHLPPAISWWPPAPGWWILLGFCGFCLWLSLIYCKRRYQAQRPKQEAYQCLEQYKNDYLETGDLSTAYAEINALLKRVSLHYYPRSLVAAKHGEAWIQFLKDTSDKLSFEHIQTDLCAYPYQTMPTTPTEQRLATIQPLLLLAKGWIAQQKPHQSTTAGSATCSN